MSQRGGGTAFSARAAVAACCVLASCTAVRHVDGTVGVTTTKGGNLLNLRSMNGDRSQREVRMDAFCANPTSLLAGATALDCQLVPLGDPAAELCDRSLVTGTTEPPKVAQDRPKPCAPLAIDVAAQTVGWAVLASGGERQLSIFLGPRGVQGGTGTAAPVTTSATRAGATLLERFRASLPAAKVSELAVCPGDLDGDGALELIVLTRATDDPATTDVDESARPEVVAAWLHPSGKLEAQDPVRALDPGADLPRARGEGCASPAVVALRYGNGSLHIDEQAPATTRFPQTPR